jgi:RNA polymerase sigma factor (sigma-70 family)
MRRRARSNVLQHLRRAALLGDGAGLTDALLLEGFLARRDGACFEALVRRHGPMVLGVCRRLLRDPHDAEDAFQATFLVLVRRAASVVPKAMVGNWLYGVACRTALEARRSAARRQARERQVHDMPQPSVEAESIWHDLQPLLDEELNRLPDKYRAAVVLCDLQGRTRKEAARQLGVPEGTVSGRLTTARRLLARRLTRRGLALSLGTVAMALSHGSATATVPKSLLASAVLTVDGGVPAPVVALAERVVKGLFLAKLKGIATVFLAIALLTGAGFAVHRVVAAEPQQAEKEDRTPRGRAVDAGEKSDLDKLQGTWVAVSSEWDGKTDSGEAVREHKLVVAGRRLTYWTRKGPHEASFRLDPAREPREIDMDFDGGALTRGIYEFDGDRLKLRWSKVGERPGGFDTDDGDVLAILMVYEKK